MNKFVRQMEILNYLSTISFCTLENLSEHFNVSLVTIRRDVNELFEKELIIKYYGGIKLAKKNVSTYDKRIETQTEAKHKIAKLAATLIEDNDCFLVDAGSTCALLADYIPSEYNLNIVTNNFEFIDRSKNNENWRITVVGKIFNVKSYSFIEENDWNYYSSLNFNKAFLGTTGFTIKSGATNPHSNEATIKTHMVALSEEPILLADSSKFNQISLYTYARADAFAKIITDKERNKDYNSYLSKNNVELIIAE